MVKSTKKKLFLKQLKNILDDKSNKKYICWDKKGKAILIRNEKEFSKIVLPKYYKHDNLDSFIRQLNLYNFSGKRNKEGWLKYENQGFFKTMTDEDLKKLESQKKKKKKRKIIGQPKETVKEEEIDIKEIRKLLNDCLDGLKELLVKQNKVSVQIVNLEKEKKKEQEYNEFQKSILNNQKNTNINLNASCLSNSSINCNYGPNNGIRNNYNIFENAVTMSNLHIYKNNCNNIMPYNLESSYIN